MSRRAWRIAWWAMGVSAVVLGFLGVAVDMRFILGGMALCLLAGVVGLFWLMFSIVDGEW